MLQRSIPRATVLLLTLVLASCAQAPRETPTPAPAPAAPAAPPEQPKLQAPLFDNLGSYSSKITTSSPLTQRFFDQGLTLAYGFNHAEAARSFREGARLDPQCAMCYWGVAFVLGPNINIPMLPDGVAEAWSASRKALELSAHASPREQALIQALAARYAEEPPEDRSALDRAFADAMRTAAKNFPDDADVQTVFAESLMDLTPWDYYAADGTPKGATPEILAALEHVLAANPQHPGANHYYIHAVEASRHPEQGEPAADRLGPLAPGAGHLVHMPSHIYIRIGRYYDAAVANIKAGEADMAYIAQCQAQGIYPLAYHPHNWHFLWASATFLGKKQWAREGAQKVRELMGTHSHADPMFGAFIQHFWLAPVYDDVRFARWDEILAMPEPEDHPYTRAIWHYARGMALSARGDSTGARHELASLSKYAADPALKATQISVRNYAKQLVDIAQLVLQADVATRQKHYAEGITLLTRARDLEDALGYSEPEDWHYPVRLLLGAVQLRAAQAADAERSYREDLDRHPENGWALLGLEHSLLAQKKANEAAAVHERFVTAWKYADTSLTASVLR